jgi:hypothetical protein
VNGNEIEAVDVEPRRERRIAVSLKPLHVCLGCALQAVASIPTRVTSLGIEPKGPLPAERFFRSHAASAASTHLHVPDLDLELI